MSCQSQAPLMAARIDALFAKGRIAGWRFRRLWHHLEECAACRDYYDRVAVVWRAMGTGAEPPQVAEMRAQAAVDRIVASEARRPSRVMAWSLVVASAAAVLALVMFLRPGRDGGDGTWTERGGGAATARDRGVRAFCIARSPTGELEVRGEVASSTMVSTATTALSCRLADEVQFAYSLGAGELEYLTLVGRDLDGSVHPYHPAQLDGESAVALRPGAAGEPLPGSVRLSVNHHPGTIAVEAIFTREPLAAAAAIALVDGDSRLAGRQRLLLRVDP